MDFCAIRRLYASECQSTRPVAFCVSPRYADDANSCTWLLAIRQCDAVPEVCKLGESDTGLYSEEKGEIRAARTAHRNRASPHGIEGKNRKFCTSAFATRLATSRLASARRRNAKSAWLPSERGRRGGRGSIKIRQPWRKKIYNEYDEFGQADIAESSARQALHAYIKIILLPLNLGRECCFARCGSDDSTGVKRQISILRGQYSKPAPSADDPPPQAPPARCARPRARARPRRAYATSVTPVATVPRLPVPSVCIQSLCELHF